MLRLLIRIMRNSLHIKSITTIILLIFLGLTTSSFTQDRKIDLLERLYIQGNFKRLVKKATKLATKDGYQTNPKVYFYKSLGLIGLSNDKRYTYGHPMVKDEIKDAIDQYLDVDPNMVLANNYELTLDERTYFDLSIESKETVLDTIQFKDTSVVENIEIVKKPLESIKSDKKKDEKIPVEEIYTTEEKLIIYAETFLGTPYKYGGMNENGFDCSGFTSYVMKSFGYSLPRSARDQYAAAKKIKKGKAKKGDLVFFGRNKNNISHVGIVSSNQGEELTMIHASSSRGIMYTNVDQDIYWKPKLIGVGRIEN